MKQVVRSVSGDNLVFYFSTILWLRIHQETVWVNINLEKINLLFNIVITEKQPFEKINFFTKK